MTPTSLFYSRQECAIPPIHPKKFFPPKSWYKKIFFRRWTFKKVSSVKKRLGQKNRLLHAGPWASSVITRAVFSFFKYFNLSVFNEHLLVTVHLESEVNRGQNLLHLDRENEPNALPPDHNQTLTKPLVGQLLSWREEVILSKE